MRYILLTTILQYIHHINFTRASHVLKIRIYSLHQDRILSKTFTVYLGTEKCIVVRNFLCLNEQNRRALSA